jgi:DNA polymerase III subunit gamma/tau
MKAMQARSAVSLDSVLKQLGQLRQEAGGGGQVPALARTTEVSGVPAATPAPAPRTVAAVTPPIAPAPAPSLSAPALAPAPPPVAVPPVASVPVVPVVATPRPAEVESAPLLAAAAASGPIDPAELWAQVVASAGPMIRSALQAGTPVSWEKGVLTIGYPGAMEGQRAMAESERTRKTVESKLAELGRPGTVKFVRIADPAGGAAASAPGPTAAAVGGGSARGTGTPAPGAAAASAASRAKPEKVVPLKISDAEFKNDPLIKEALELFKAQRVDVDLPSDPGAGG